MPKPVTVTKDSNPLLGDMSSNISSQQKPLDDEKNSADSVHKNSIKVDYLDTPVKSTNDKKDYK